MLEALRSLFARTSEGMAGGPRAAGDPATHRLRVACCALMLEVAHADDSFDEAERAHIEHTLGEHFQMEPAEVRELMRVADEARREAIDLHQFTSVLTAHYGDDERFAIAEMLWRVVAADGVLSPKEEAFTRAFRRLLDLAPARFAEARRRAFEGRAAG